jgi:hypothetical protein
MMKSGRNADARQDQWPQTAVSHQMTRHFGLGLVSALTAAIPFGCSLPESPSSQHLACHFGTCGDLLFAKLGFLMRIPFPARINLSYALVFATALSVVQLLEGTNPFFSACVFCFILTAAVGFNIAGGLPYPSGAFIGFNAFFTLLLPMTVKAILGESADSNLHAPMRTIEVYLLGMVAILAAVIVSRRFRKRKALISGMLPENALHSAYVGSAAFSIILTFLLAVVPYGSGSIGSFLIQADRFPMLTFLLGVIYTVRRSNGRRSVSWPLLAMILYSSLGALLTFSKEQFLSPFFAWAIAAALVRYRLHWVNILSFIFGLYFVVTFMVPYAQYGRGFETDLSHVQLSAYLLSHMDEVRQAYKDNSANLGDLHYFNRPLGLLDRLNVLPGDAALIDVTDREGSFGFLPIYQGFGNIVPHVFYPNKPIIRFANIYAHQIGILADEDETTGVSFSPTSDAYHEGKVLGVLVAEPLVLMLIFLVLDSVIGDVRLNPVGLLTTILISRAASEGSLYFSPVLIGQYLFTNVLAAYICAYVLPILGSLFNKPLLLPSPAPVSELVHE